jgi:hypothetical protein
MRERVNGDTVSVRREEAFTNFIEAAATFVKDR